MKLEQLYQFDPRIRTKSSNWWRMLWFIGECFDLTPLVPCVCMTCRPSQEGRLEGPRSVPKGKQDSEEWECCARGRSWGPECDITCGASGQIDITFHAQHGNPDIQNIWKYIKYMRISPIDTVYMHIYIYFFFFYKNYICGPWGPWANGAHSGGPTPWPHNPTPAPRPPVPGPTAPAPRP